MLISKALPLFAAVLVIGTAGGKLICLESGPNAASRQSIRGNREYDILLNTNQTVLCRPGVAYQPDSVLSVIDYQPNGARYNMLPRIPPIDLGAPASETPALPGGEEVRSHLRSPLFPSRMPRSFPTPLRHVSTTYLGIPSKKIHNQRLGIVPN